MMRSRELVCACVALLVTAGSAQVVTFSDPSDWMTQPSDTIVMKTQLDTAQIESGKVDLTLYLVEDGKSKRLARKTFAADDFSKEYRLGVVKRTVVGGYDYLKVDWSIPGSKKQGVCQPFGVVNLDKLPSAEPVAAKRVADGLSGEELVKALTGNGSAELGGMTYSVGWNADALWFACTGGEGVLEVILDGKNGKNAYLSYPDRVLHLVPAADSAYVYHYKRALKDEAITYTETVWHSDMVRESVGGHVVVGLKWYDTGIIPEDNRTFGFGAFATDRDGVVKASLWKGSSRVVPGTWGDMKLVK